MFQGLGGRNLTLSKVSVKSYTMVNWDSKYNIGDKPHKINNLNTILTIILGYLMLLNSTFSKIFVLS